MTRYMELFHKADEKLARLQKLHKKASDDLDRHQRYILATGQELQFSRFVLRDCGMDDEHIQRLLGPEAQARS